MNFKPPLFPAISSLLCGVFVFLFFFIFHTPGASGEGCIVLSVDESQDDRFILESLDNLRLGSFISESSQEVYLDNFGELINIPLNLYNSEVNYFDPRNDGYASLLTSFFVRDGMRFFYLPMNNISGVRTADLTRKLENLLGEIPFHLSVMGERNLLFPFLFFYSAACILVFLFCRSRRLFVYKLPVLLALGFCGPPAFIMAAALIGIWELLREPLVELQAFRYNNRWQRDYAGTGLRGFLERFWPFRLNFVLVFFLVFFLVVYVFMGGIPVLPAALGIICFFGLYYPVLKVEKKRVQESQHVLFTPILLHPQKTKTFHLFPLLLPLGFFHVFFITLILPNYSHPVDNDNLPENPAAYIIRAEDYYRHIDFQSSFSYMPLGRDNFIQDGYYRYYMDEDGLISGVWENYVNERELHPFPLEELMGFLLHYYNNRAITSGSTGGQPGLGYTFQFREWIFTALIITLCSLDLFHPWMRYKRIAA